MGCGLVEQPLLSVKVRVVDLLCCHNSYLAYLWLHLMTCTCHLSIVDVMFMQFSSQPLIKFAKELLRLCS